MRNKPAAQTIFTWLRNNGVRLGALTSHDTVALMAAVQCAELWLRGDGDSRELSKVAFRNCVLQMQEKTQFMAFHAIAHVGDWCHRRELWLDADLPFEVLHGVPECEYGPRTLPRVEVQNAVQPAEAA